MGRQITSLDFDQWVKHIFDHPVTDPEWYWKEDAECWDGPPTLTAKYLARLFEDPEDVLRPFSDAQVNQGLWYMASNACSSIMADGLNDPGVPWPERCRCLRSIGALFERCFAKRCSNHLSHLDEPDADPLNLVCYMWWEIFPIWGNRRDLGKRERDRVILDVMRRTLELPSEACRESALHGLGHWRAEYPEVVVPIIDGFLTRFPAVRGPLRNYALAAREGSVL